MGPSGSGKSTLLHCLAGLDRLTSGQIFLGDVEISRASEKQLTLIRRDQLGFVFQAYNLIPTLNALENITLPMALAGTQARPGVVRHDRRRPSARATASTHRPSELSGGQQQRVAVGARARSASPRSSSPTSPPATSTRARAPRSSTFMRKAVDDLGQTIVMVTHDPIAAGYADRVVFLADGKIVDEMLDPTADRVLDRMKSLGD